MSDLHIGRMHQTIVGGEVAAVTLELIKDDAGVELVDGDSFVTVSLAVDPWALPS